MWVSSFKLILRNNWLVYMLIFVIGFFGAIIAALIFPGAEGVQAILGIADTPFARSFFIGILEGLDSNNSEFFLWFVFLYYIAYMSNLYPVAGLWLGGSGISTEIDTGMADLFISSPHKKEKLVLRHLLSHLILLTFFTAMICGLIPISFELLNMSINYNRLLLSFILLLFSSIFFYSLSFFFTVLALRSDIGRGFSTLLFLLSFVFNLIIAMNPTFEDLKYFNILYYLNGVPILLEGNSLTIDNLFPPILSFFLFLIGILIFTIRDPLPPFRKTIFTKRFSLNRIRSIFKRFFPLNLSLEKYLKKISPIIAEQWIADKIIFIIFFIFLFFGALSIIFGYPTGEGGFAEMSKIYQNNPLVKAILRDSLDLIVDDPLGPIYPQFYGYTWLYFFPIVVIGAGRIIDRDRDNKTVDIIFTMPKKQREFILYRLICVLIELSILSTMTILIIILGEFYLNIESKLIEQLLTLLIVPLSYFSILSFLVAVSLFITPEHRKKVIYGLSVFFIITVNIAYFSKPLMPLRFLSPLYYMDLITLIVFSYQFEDLSLLSVLGGLLIVSLFVIYRYSDNTAHI